MYALTLIICKYTISITESQWGFLQQTCTPLKFAFNFQLNIHCCVLEVGQLIIRHDEGTNFV
jgi:hypothetical protein